MPWPRYKFVFSHCQLIQLPKIWRQLSWWNGSRNPDRSSGKPWKPKSSSVQSLSVPARTSPFCFRLGSWASGNLSPTVTRWIWQTNPASGTIGSRRSRFAPSCMFLLSIFKCKPGCLILVVPQAWSEWLQQAKWCQSDWTGTTWGLLCAHAKAYLEIWLFRRTWAGKLIES